MTGPNSRTFSLFPKTLERCVEPLLRPVLKKQGLAGTRILTDWESIVGPHLARFSYPEKLAFARGEKTGGTLTISAQSGFATELQHMQPLILERLALYFGYQAVARIIISHSWQPAGPAPAAPPKPTLTKASAALADHVDDPALRAALQSLAGSLAGQ